MRELHEACEDEKGRELPKGKCVSSVCELVKGMWDQAGTAQDKW